MHAADGRSAEDAAGGDAAPGDDLVGADGDEGGQEDDDGHEKGDGGEAARVLDLQLWLSIGEVDGCVAYEVLESRTEVSRDQKAEGAHFTHHAPDGDAAHGYCRAHEECPASVRFVLLHGNDILVKQPIRSRPTTNQLERRRSADEADDVAEGDEAGIVALGHGLALVLTKESLCGHGWLDICSNLEE